MKITIDKPLRNEFQILIGETEKTAQWYTLPYDGNYTEEQVYEIRSPLPYIDYVENISKLNELAVKIAALDNADLVKLKAVMELGEIENVEETIEIIDSLLEFEFDPLPRDENSYGKKYLQSGRLNGKGGLSAKSVRDILTVYRSIERYAYREYGIRESNFTMPKTEQHYTDVLTAAERRSLENYLINNMNLTNLAVLLCLFTGLRIGELCGLKWEDIDFATNTLSVKRTVQRITKNGKSPVIIGSPKSRTSVRVVPIPAFLMTLLNDYKSFGGFYIITNTVKPTEPRTMQNRFKSILKSCGIRNVNFHLLRHTYATVCIEKGFDPKTLSELLGHADAAITLNRYVHSSMEIKKNYVSRLCLSA